MIKVLHVINGLELGGAEMVLLRLVERMDRSRFANEVISLTAGGQLEDRLVEAGADVLSLKGGPSSPRVFFRVMQAARDRRPQVMQTWMYHADLVGGLAGRLARNFPIVWGIHAGPLPPKGQRRMMKIGTRLLAALSHSIPSLIVCCSQTSLDVHGSLGYARNKMVVIPNGFESRALEAERSSGLREQLGIPSDAAVIGRIARFHPQKDIANVLEAFLRLPRTPHLILAGTGMDWGNFELRDLIARNGSSDRVHLLGEVPEPVPLYRACDLVVSSSAYGEAMPLVLGEAMALGVPVVTTDVGDSKYLVGDHARVVPPGDPVALSTAVQRVLDLPRDERMRLGERDCHRISSLYSRAAMVDSYQELYQGLVS